MDTEASDEREIKGFEDYPAWTRHTKNIYDRYVNDFEFDIGGKKIILKQDNVVVPEDLGNTVWDGALVLASYFANEKVFPEGYWKNKSVVELGAGTGLVGLFTALLGAQVVLTDKAPQTTLLEENVKKNGLTAAVKEYLWGSDPAPLSPPFDVVIASECIYYEELVDPLCASLQQLTSAHSTVYVSFEAHRPDSVDMFRQKVEPAFTIREISSSDLHPLYTSNKITLWQLQKKQQP